MARTARNPRFADATDGTRHEDGKLKKFVWLVIGPHVWGKGFSARQAFDAAGKPKSYVVLVSSDPWVYVDDMGGICYYPENPDAPMAAPLPYFAVALKSPKGVHTEVTIENGKAFTMRGTGKHFVVDERYKSDL